MQPHDVIEIRRLKVETWIGVPDDERSKSQPLWITVKMVPHHSFSEMEDHIVNTVDYARVAEQLKSIAAQKPRHLIETLAIEIAEMLLSSHGLSHISVSVEKQILPDTDYVAVHIERSVSQVK
jgi:dihydroneopterin aldolase